MTDPQEQIAEVPGTETASTEAPPPRPPKRKRLYDTGMVATIQSLLGTITIAVFVITFIIQAFTIPSESMENTLLIGDYLLVDKAHFSEGWAHGFMPYSKVARKEIVVFRYPIHPATYFVKRVVGIPGDRVRLIDKKVYVNGELQNEPYVVFSKPFDAYRDEFPNGPWWSLDVDAHWGMEMRRLVEDKQLIVPQDCYFVMGDNRDDSLDSRYWGFVPKENIVGRPLLIYFSMDGGEAQPPATSLGDKLLSLALRAKHAFWEIRWKRVVRLVR